jgi:hypothetical protein
MTRCGIEKVVGILGMFFPIVVQECSPESAVGTNLFRNQALILSLLELLSHGVEVGGIDMKESGGTTFGENWQKLFTRYVWQRVFNAKSPVLIVLKTTHTPLDLLSARAPFVS